MLVTQTTGKDPTAWIETVKTCTPLPFQEVTDSAVVAADRIYFAPATMRLLINEGLLQATAENEPAVDLLFQSLAKERGDDAIGILLSRCESDSGLKAIADVGGMTMAMESLGAQSDSSLHEGLLSGVIDHLLPPEKMPQELLGYARHLNALTTGGDSDNQSAQIAQHLDTICDLLLETTQTDFKHYKTPTLVRRIQHRLQVLRMEQVDQYVEKLRNEPKERRTLFKKLLVGVTAFFRDPESFAEVAEQAITGLLNAKNPSEPIRVWVVGCSTGEEAYTLAILFKECMATLDNPPGLQIFATDIDEKALAIARKGYYSADALNEHVSTERLQRFFVQQGSDYQVCAEIRELCLFSHHNLINDPPLVDIDLLSCRNLLIYLGPHLQKKSFSIFHYALNPGGFLFLGPAENVSAHKELFEIISARYRLCRRRETTVDQSTDSRPFPASSPGKRLRSGPPATDTNQLGQITERILLDEFAPKYAVINEVGEVQYLAAGADKYLEYSAGSFSSHIVRIARSGLRAGLRAALDEANKARRRVITDALSITTDQGLQRVMVTIQPMPKLGADESLHMVVFQDIGLPQRLDQEETEAGTNLVVVQLEQQLHHTRLDLERTVQALEQANEDLKTTNEELLVMNEELRASNAALETAKEEVERQRHVVAQTNDDLENLLNSTQIATLLLGHALTIRRFTPAMSQLYNLIPSDIDRPLTDITHRLCDPPPLPDVRVLQNDSAPIQNDVRTTEGQWYIRQVSPYRTHTGEYDGMVVTFTDVTALHESEERYRRQYAELETLYHTAPVGLALFDTELRYLRINERLADINGLPPAEHIGRTLEEVLPGVAGSVAPILRQVLTSGEPVLELEVSGNTHKDPDTQHIWLASYYPIKNDAGTVEAVSAVVQEITERKHAEAALHESARYKDEYLAMLAHELRNPLAPLRNAAQVLRILDAPDPRLGELQSIIDRQVDHMARMLDDLLDISRIARGKLQLEEEKLDLAELVRQTAEDFRATIEQQELSLTVNVPQGQLWVQGDPTRLMQVLGNLLRNAVQYTPAGGEIGLQVDIDSNSDAVWIHISDTGVGIPPAMADHLFEAFWQGDGLNRGTGLGLGLALVKGFVELHGGTVQATSAGEQRGSEFHICLPLLERPAFPSGALSESAAEQRALRILVVDDSRDTADTLGLLLEHEGHNVTVAYSGEQSLAVAQEYKPDVVLCDIGLPGALDGYGVARAFRNDPLLRGTYLIAVTGYGREQDRDDADAAGFNDHLLKPVSMDDLHYALAKRAQL
ncbi:MAG: CheR family methyltransferase [Candidatus Competibacteraceae bacterium]